MSWFTPLLFATMLAGCAANGPFYAPSHQQFRSADSYHHRYTPFTVESASGNRLDAQWHHSNGQPLGLVVHFHGNRGNLSDTIEKVEWLLDEGYDVVVFDYSGYGQTPGTPSPEATFADARAMIQWLTDQPRPTANYRKVVIANSLGGAIMISGLADPLTPPDLDLMVIDSSFYRYSDIARSVVATYPLGDAALWLVDLLVDDGYAPAGRVARLPQVPLVVSHCVDDQLIPIRFSAQIYAEARGAKTFWQLPDCRHARSYTNEHPLNQQLLLEVINQPSLVNPEYSYEAALRQWQAGQPQLAGGVPASAASR